MTDNEETRSYNDILQDNKELRKAINVEFGEHMFDAGYRLAIDNSVRHGHYKWADRFAKAIAAWKAQQGGDND